MAKCVMARTDGFELRMREFPNYEAAYNEMKRQYDLDYDPAEDRDDESYLGTHDALVVITECERFMWSILEVSA